MSDINITKYKIEVRGIADGRISMPPPFIDPATGCYIPLGLKPDRKGYARITFRHWQDPYRQYPAGLRALAFLYANRKSIDLDYGYLASAGIAPSVMGNAIGTIGYPACGGDRP